MAVGEWDRRELCPDGGCTGVIGPDGHCKVCGRAATNWGNERERGLKGDAQADADVDAEDDELEDDEEWEDEDEDGHEDDEEEGDGDEVDEIDPSAPARLGEVKEWSERELCSDGGCIGVIGDRGTCNVCGKPGNRRRAPAITPAAPAAQTQGETQAETEDDPPRSDAELEAAAAQLAGVAAEDDGNRKLCPDGACVGVIGADGKCKVCGKEAA